VTIAADNACGSIAVGLDVADANSCASHCEKTVNVVDTTAPVVASCPTNGTIQCPATPSFGSPEFTDDCDQSLTVTFADVTTPGACPQAYAVTRTWTAKDDCNNTSTCAQTITVQDITAPVIAGVGGPQTIECPATPSFSSPTASDVCDPNPSLTHNDVTTPGACPQAFSVTRTWTAKDACNNTSTASQTITVQDNTPPVISGVGGPQTIECPASPSFSSPTASDLCDPNPSLTHNDVTTPGTCPQEFSVTRTWTAKDACNNTSTASQTITVEDNTAPVITGVGGPSTVICPATPQFSHPTATDACDPNPTLTFADTRTPGDCPQYTVTRTWTATDHCGNSRTASQSITVVDDTAPVISGVGGPQTIECPASPQFSNPAATDACDPNPSLTHNDVTTPGSCPQEFSVTRTWTAKDVCNNTSTASQTITVQDNTAPVLNCPGDIAGACDQPVTFVATATDACDASPTVVCNPPSGTVFQTGTATVTCTATDDCGNSSQCAFHVITPSCEKLCWLTGGGAAFDPTLNIYVAQVSSRHNFGGNVYPGCSSTAGDGGQWNHLDAARKLHFQGFAVTVDRCGNVDGIPPGSTSPVTPFNFIEFHGTGRVLGVKGNKANYPLVYFFARCEDRNEPGSNGQRDGAGKDRYFLHVYSDQADPIGSTLILVDQDGNPATVDPVIITDGNLQIHISSCDNPPVFAQGTQTGISETSLDASQPGVETGETPDGMSDLQLYRPMPNPFAHTTRFAYSVPSGNGVAVDIAVYDLAGRRVKGLVSGTVDAGRHETSWDGRDEGGFRVNNGVYFIHSTIGSQRKTVSVVYVK
jgi:hypothetical protein